MNKIWMLAILAWACCHAAAATSIALPNETAMYPATSHPGYLPALQKCLICHSADYAALQPPLSEARWRDITEKMRLAFKAPLTAEEAVLIAGYLADAQRQGVLSSRPPPAGSR
ncbi:hypothetical protein [Chromobacterium aquaticum]|uniref:Sulfite:cytochrome C oxidoreductase subunit B n=1 Tax=Chromobacterium aquaticum TaxID=467180 RepID=A0ABV8ZZZ5_9NEIS|nr:hypothetical protein [Chromobacterium aquaticum]MCD5364440.1 hypothetical protein [Chromobacterium aquaticum]